MVLKTTNGGVTFINNQNGKIPTGYELYQNYPNPFNAMTVIRFKLPVGARRVALTVFDLNGKEIFVPVNKTLSAGEYEIPVDANDFASGIYFYSLEVDNLLISAKKMILIK